MEPFHDAGDVHKAQKRDVELVIAGGHTTWILVLRPPRVMPIACGPLVFLATAEDWCARHQVESTIITYMSGCCTPWKRRSKCLFCSNTHSAGTPRSKRPAARACRARARPSGLSTAGHHRLGSQPRGRFGRVDTAGHQSAAGRYVQMASPWHPSSTCRQARSV